MISPDDIRKKALQLWDSQEILRAYIEERNLFPWKIRFTKPRSADWSNRFAEARDWVRKLRAESKETLGYGYTLEFQTVNHRRLGTQSLPAQIRVDSIDDFLRLAGKQREYERFQRLAQRTFTEIPALRRFLARRPFEGLRHNRQWEQILGVCKALANHPKPGVYIRQMDISGVDSKFVEAYKGLLFELLEMILSSDAQDISVRGLSDHGFERRFGLQFEAPAVRFRLLDSRLATAGLTDLTVPLPEFERLALPLDQAFIVENKINGLAFPEVPSSLVIFGLGYGVGMLAGVPWLQRLRLYYWGDIDTHGFSILDRLREYLPATRSFLMDLETLHRFRELWGQEEPVQRCARELTHLSSDERATYETLRDNRLGERIRLEQERISYSYLQQTLTNLTS